MSLRELPSEEWAGVGLGIVVGLAVLLWPALRGRSRTPARSGVTGGPALKLFLATPWIALLVFMGKSGMAPESRILLPYFPLLLPGLLIPVQSPGASRSGLLRAAGFFTLLTTILIVMINPARPLFPALTLLGSPSASHPDSGLRGRARRVFSAYRERHDTFKILRLQIPPGEAKIGFISLPSAGDFPLASLWHENCHTHPAPKRSLKLWRASIMSSRMPVLLKTPDPPRWRAGWKETTGRWSNPPASRSPRPLRTRHNC